MPTYAPLPPAEQWLALGVYELNSADLLRDVFVWAHARSLVPPDLMRLRYRSALAEMIRTLVRLDLPATTEHVRARVPSEVAPADVDAFVRLVEAEFAALHAGNAVRFGIRPLEYQAWRERHPAAGGP